MKKSTTYKISAWWLYDSIYFTPKTIKNARKLIQKLKKQNWQVAVWRETTTKSTFKTERIWRETLDNE